MKQQNIGSKKSSGVAERRALSAVLLVLMMGAAWLGAGGCNRNEPPIVRQVVAHRSNCEVCHQPRDGDGGIVGLEHAHPASNLSCTDCHGGNDRICDGSMAGTEADPTCAGKWIYDKSRAHVPSGDGPTFLKNLSAQELDDIDKDYLQFINPGDFRVAERACGASGCHQEAVDIVPRSTMAHTSGELAVARYRAGAQPDPKGRFSAVDVTDPAASRDECASAEYAQFLPQRFEFLDSAAAPEGVNVANAQDQYMVKSCMRCHLNDFGENRFTADFRSSGCTACHMKYADDGLSHSADPRINKDTVPHPATHELVKAVPTEQCTHCHYRGARIGISFQGYREAAGPGLNSDEIEPYGPAQHGHDSSFYIADEDTTNDYDETLPDVHFEAGMHCVDCHTKAEIHGNGHLYADTQCAVHTECEDCHGSVRERATPTSARPNLTERDGKLFLHTKITNLDLEVHQVKDSVTPGHARYSPVAAMGMGLNADGYSHTDDVECYTCHAGWVPTCYGCHVDVDFTRSKRYQTDGTILPGHPSGTRGWVSLFDLVLMRNTDGKLAPSMPAERLFMTIKGVNQARGDAGAAAPSDVTAKPRTFTFHDENGKPGRTIAGFGQRAINPHTTRRRSQFMACDRCHSVGDPQAPENEILLDITYGFGSERYPQLGCDVTNEDTSCQGDDQALYQLDAVQTRAGEPLVVVGHEGAAASRPLTLEEIARMRAIQVPETAPFVTKIPADALTNPAWPGPIRLE